MTSFCVLQQWNQAFNGLVFTVLVKSIAGEHRKRFSYVHMSSIELSVFFFLYKKNSSIGFHDKH